MVNLRTLTSSHAVETTSYGAQWSRLSMINFRMPNLGNIGEDLAYSHSSSCSSEGYELSDVSSGTAREDDVEV